MSQIVALLSGVVLLVILGHLPWVGWFVYLASFLLAAGSLLLALRRGRTSTSPATS
jgi:hypothetical protein